MNQKTLTISAAALVALVAVSGVAFMSYAATDDDTVGTGLGDRIRQHMNLSDEEMAELDAERAEFRAERDVEREARQAAIASGDYATWLETVPEDAPIREKVTTANFGRFVEAHALMEEGRDILQDELGIERGDMGHEGFGKGMGKRGGMHRPGGPMTDSIQ